MTFKSFLDPLPRVVAHRGDSANYPENTIEAFKSANRLGVDVIETDVHLTKDNQIVIWHDDTLERNTDGKGRIEDHTLEELKKYDAGYTFTKDGGKTFPFRGKGVRLMTLEEALTELPEQRYNVDLKTDAPVIADYFKETIKRCKAEKRVCVASFHLNNLKRIRKIAPEIQSSLTTGEVVPKVLFKTFYPNRETKMRLVFQVPRKAGPIKVITPSFIKKWHKKNAVIMVWTINERDEMKELYEMGVDTVMTDHPEILIEVAKELKIR